ncbi:MAG: tetratricopeptide repeat protein [Myxococcaceae bacterium]
MTRPARNRLIVAVVLVATVLAAPRLPTVATWIGAALGAPFVLVALLVTRPFHRARALLAQRRFDEAALELAAFEQDVQSAAWKRVMGAMAVGLYTSNPLAAARNTLGAVRLEQGRLEDAKKHFVTALELDPGYAVPHGNLAVLAAMSGDRASAEEARVKAKSLGFAPKLLERVIADTLAGR